ncbi:hypothetical protein [Janthinobacterium sp. GW458P]|uniref:hypothetical protein n=1 Tax=Janthinobacterium sp. GW458P TaxID=1981504 RepID=UPI000A32172B|nr:hypothetical protein [Janthinobacterium sp. GW458P]MBE3027917.1 hypothetical protein [Janthinobacterium sp. GW458P]
MQKPDKRASYDPWLLKPSQAKPSQAKPSQAKPRLLAHYRKPEDLIGENGIYICHIVQIPAGYAAAPGAILQICQVLAIPRKMQASRV